MTDHDTPVLADLGRLLDRDLETLMREVHLMPDDQSLWATLPGVANSVGNLAAHCAGNLQHYVGAVLGGSGYVRDRPREFSRRTGTRAEVAAELEQARAVVASTLAALPASRLAEPYPEAVGGMTLPTGRFLLHLAVHLGFHLGQADYLRRSMTGDVRTADTVAIRALA
jgi:uncharacterized damage-inducible protein DinB